MWILYLAFSPMLLSLWAQFFWTSVPAHIVEASVAISQGGSTYRLKALYWYEIDGKRYESDDVCFYTGYDNVDSFHQDKFKELEPFIKSSEPFRTFVNPGDPGSAMLFPEVRGAASVLFGIFGLVLSGIGYGLILGGWFGARSSRDIAQRHAAYPNEPWLQHKEWAEKKVIYNSRLKVLVLALVALVWNGLSSFVPAAVFKELSKEAPQYPVLLLCLFPLIGLVLLWILGVAFMRWRRFGNSQLLLSAVPFRIGQEFRATLVVPPALLDSAPALSVTLTCECQRITGTGKNRKTERHSVAEAKTEIRLSAGMKRPDGAHIPLKMLVPVLGTPTSMDENPRYIWRLSCEADIPGANYFSEFEVPVF